MRETGPVSKDLRGGDDAMPYIGFARTLLGQLKADMEFGDQDFGKRAKVMEDGTTVVAISAYGIDKVRIIAPQEPPPEWTPPQVDEPEVPPPEEPQWKLRGDELDDKMVRICGNSGDDAWVWSPGESAVTLLPKLGMPISRCYAISGDGAVVVGTCFDTNSHVYAVRWTHGGSGWVADAIGGPNDGLMEAVSINEDGSVITGHGFTAIGYNPFGVTTADIPVRQWTWTKDGGIVKLENSHLPQGEIGAVVSPNGEWVAGNTQWFHSKYAIGFKYVTLTKVPPTGYNVVVIYSSDYFAGDQAAVEQWTASTSKPATWQRASSGIFGTAVEHYDGFLYTIHNSQLPEYPDVAYSFPNQFEARIRGVANDGTFVGELDGRYGFVCRGGSYTYYNPPRRDQLEVLTNDYEIPYGISADANRIAGVTISYNGDPDRAWVRTDGSKRDLGPGGVYAITPDGMWMAGYSGSDAVYWPYRTGIARTIPSTGHTMWATGIGRIRIQVDEEGTPTVTTKNVKF